MDIKIHIPQHDIQRYPLHYFELNNKDGLSKKNNQMYEILKDKPYNTSASMLWSDGYGNLRIIMIVYSQKTQYGPERFTITMWDEKGGTTLCVINQLVINKETDILNNENYKILSQKSEMWMNGKMNCSKCGCEIDYKENFHHRYFAGIYCQTCWEGGMKQIEAQENYN